jgi:inhibitor of KinA sporulation pathway (predicted exonuclease)
LENTNEIGEMMSIENIIAIDCEFNQLNGKPKIIQIGAAVYNVHTGELLEQMEVYVNPNEPITEYITKLTGITNSNVQNGITIREAYQQLRALHTKHKCFCNPLVWGSGIRNDSQAIYEETGFTHENGGDNFMGFRVLDVKTLYQSMAIFKDRTHAGGLETTCKKYLKIGFEGEKHRALNDAKNTFRIWFHLMKMFDNGIKNS